MATIVKVTPNNKDQFLNDNKDLFIILGFDAEFTGQKDLVRSAFETLDRETDFKDKIALGLVDVEENNDFARELSIVSVPMIVTYARGKLLKRISMLKPDELVRIIKQDLQQYEFVPDGGESLGQADKLKRYLKSLIERSPVMVFMKGSPAAPRCGFSRQLVELLGKYNVHYDTFDILEDDDVRQGLKEYSDWPTYPQIYVKGEFIGGLDILKQLDGSGELENSLRV